MNGAATRHSPASTQPRLARLARRISGAGVGLGVVVLLWALLDATPSRASARGPTFGRPFRVLTFNAGTTTGLPHDLGPDDGYSQHDAEIADALYENSLSWNPAERALTRFLAETRPDIAFFQELYFDPWCETISVDPALDFVCEDYTPERPLQIERLLGGDYQVACADGQEDNCAGSGATSAGSVNDRQCMPRPTKRNRRTGCQSPAVRTHADAAPAGVSPKPTTVTAASRPACANTPTQSAGSGKSGVTRASTSGPSASAMPHAVNRGASHSTVSPWSLIPAGPDHNRSRPTRPLNTASMTARGRARS
ncbi:MAG: hypothetical protein KDM81_14290 [Verrucomicrobiae bacterium]|nr:hypothetical protein [Verrucomicrobiae bacterium]